MTARVLKDAAHKKPHVEGGGGEGGGSKSSKATEYPVVTKTDCQK